MDLDFDLKNELTELGSCLDFTEMDEDMWVCLGEYGDEILDDEFDNEWC